jgi:hypothetical protein
MMHSVAQVSLRPDNRLSDMQAIMEQTQAFENRVLERLNAGKTVRSFLIAAVELLTEAVNILVLQVFRKDDYAVKYAVEPLLDGDGPLGDLSVRLKLIYGLGVLNRQEYEDAELLMALREELMTVTNTPLPMMRSWGPSASCTAWPRCPLPLISTAATLSYMQCKSCVISRLSAPRWSFP